MPTDERQAAEVYEIVLDDSSTPKSWLRVAIESMAGWFSMGSGGAHSAGVVVLLRRIDTGEEQFRHIEDLSPDDGHLLHDLERDLAAMTATEFRSRWLDPN